jgi:hypothetical protein
MTVSSRVLHGDVVSFWGTLCGFTMLGMMGMREVKRLRMAVVAETGMRRSIQCGFDSLSPAGYWGGGIDALKACIYV